jgi:glutathione S-transferase
VELGLRGWNVLALIINVPASAMRNGLAGAVAAIIVGQGWGPAEQEQAMRYEFYYWPSIQGRGEFVRLALEEAGADYVDVARGSEKDGRGVPALLELLNGETATPPFAPPFLRAGKLLIGQSANILLYLGGRHKLAPATENGRLWVHQLQLTVVDFIKEIHNTHHPIASSLYYEEQ